MLIVSLRSLFTPTVKSGISVYLSIVVLHVFGMNHEKNKNKTVWNLDLIMDNGRSGRDDFSMVQQLTRRRRDGRRLPTQRLRVVRALRWRLISGHRLVSPGRRADATDGVANSSHGTQQLVVGVAPVLGCVLVGRSQRDLLGVLYHGRNRWDVHHRLIKVISTDLNHRRRRKRLFRVVPTLLRKETTSMFLRASLSLSFYFSRSLFLPLSFTLSLSFFHSLSLSLFFSLVVTLFLFLTPSL